MAVPMQVRNLRDRSGKEVFTVGDSPYPMYVVGLEPQLDAFSNVVAWKHTLRRDPPRDYDQFIQEVLNA